MSVMTLVQDPQFLRMSPQDQQATLAQLDPDFGKLKPQDFAATVAVIQKQGLSRPDLVAPPSAAPAPNPQMQTSMLGELAGTGSDTEGKNATGGTVIVPKEGESFQDTMRRAAESGKQYINPVTNDLNDKGQQMVNTEMAQGGAPGVMIGGGKALLETGHTVGALAGKVLPASVDNEIGLPSSFKQPDYLQSENGAQTAGKVAENVAEFVMGDAALKSLNVLDRIGLASKLSNLAKSNPYVAKFLEIGMNSIANATRTSIVGGIQGGLHESTAEGVEHGAEAGAVGSAIGDAFSLAGKATDALGKNIGQKLNMIPEVSKALNAEEEAMSNLVSGNDQGELFKGPKDMVSQLEDALRPHEDVLNSLRSSIAKAGVDVIKTLPKPILSLVASYAVSKSNFSDPIKESLYLGLGAYGLHGTGSSIAEATSTPSALRIKQSVAEKAATILPAAGEFAKAAIAGTPQGRQNVGTAVDAVTHLYDPATQQVTPVQPDEEQQ